jgi:hypothetical protein
MVKRALAMSAALVALGHGAPAASQQAGPATSEPLATFEVVLDPEGDEMKVCTGADGTYQDIRARDTGRMDSTDARLSGVVFTDERILLNATSFVGTSIIDVRIVDEVTGVEKFRGNVTAVIKGLAVRGVMSGNFADGGFLVSNFSAYINVKPGGQRVVSGTIGSAAIVPVDVAVIQTGSC